MNNLLAAEIEQDARLSCRVNRQIKQRAEEAAALLDSPSPISQNRAG